MIVGEPLSNPEQGWVRDPRNLPDADQSVRERLGDVPGPIEPLGGGLANDSIRVGDRVLRIYRREVDALYKERALLERAWRHVRTPSVLEVGADFLVLEYVEHGPLTDATEHAEAVGRALAEIHATSFEQSGFLTTDAGRVERPFGDFVDAFCSHVGSLEAVPPDIREAIVERYEVNRALLSELASSPVLLHGDFKVSNIHWADEGRPLVLDWEFAYAGPALLDIGQLIRWGVPEGWADAFARAYGAEGGTLPEAWTALAETLDLVNLAGLLDGSEDRSRRQEDVQGRIQQTLSSVQAIHRR